MRSFDFTLVLPCEIIRPVEIDAIKLILRSRVQILFKIPLIIRINLLIGIDRVLLLIIMTN